MDDRKKANFIFLFYVYGINVEFLPCHNWGWYKRKGVHKTSLYYLSFFSQISIINVSYSLNLWQCCFLSYILKNCNCFVENYHGKSNCCSWRRWACWFTCSREKDHRWEKDSVWDWHSHESRLDVILEPKLSQDLGRSCPLSCPLQLPCDIPPLTR